MESSTFKKYVITDIDTTSKVRTGYIGRAAAFKTREGVEIIIMAKDSASIGAVIGQFTDKPLVEDAVMKVTMIASEGVSVDIDAVVPDENAAPPSDQPVQTAEHMPDIVLGQAQPSIPMRDGRPAVQYVHPTAEMAGATPVAIDDDPL